MIYFGNISIKRFFFLIYLSEYRKGEQGVLQILKLVGGMFGYSLGVIFGQVIRRIFFVILNIFFLLMSRKGFCCFLKILYYFGKKKKCEYKLL